MLLFAPAHSAAFGQRVADCLGITLAKSEEREYGGGEHRMRPVDDVHNQDVFVIQSSCADEHASANDKLCRLLFFLGALKDAGARRVTAVVPYFAYSRKDRRTQPQDPVTTRYIAQLFEAMGVDCVVALDIHNEAAFDNAFRCQSVRLEAGEMFAASLAQDLGTAAVVVASPDIGGVKRAQLFRESLARKLGREVGFAFLEKRRSGGVVSGDMLVGDVQNRTLVVYDDLIASGTTILRASKVARRAGASRVYVAAPHAAFLPEATQLFVTQDVHCVLVSDSIPLAPGFANVPGERLRVCSVAPLIADMIRADMVRRPGSPT
jgi:ribose-phosphate pyrophosphokinase